MDNHNTSSTSPTPSSTTVPSPHNKKKGANRKPRCRSQRNRKRPKTERNNTPFLDYTIRIQPLPYPTWLRTVDPYPYTFTSFAKARWIGRTVLDVYTDEFGSYPSSYYQQAIEQGRILVNDQVVSTEYDIKAPDVLSHTVHRHEPGVAVAALEEERCVPVVYEDEEMLVVSKPSTLPVHPCGGYHVQSLIPLLERQSHLQKDPSSSPLKLYTIHRLDRLTSGLVLLGKTSAAAKQWATAIRDDRTQKTYLARCHGKFSFGKFPELAVGDAPPRQGEWAGDNSTTKSLTTVQTKAMDARARNAHCVWMTKQQQSSQQEGRRIRRAMSEDDSPHDSERSSRDRYTTMMHENPFDLSSIADSSNDSKKPADATATIPQEHSSESSVCCWLHLACPTRIAQHKDGVCETGVFDDLDNETYLSTVKAAQTSFAVVHYDEESDSTVVLCRPHTGRTHQIRLHLQYLGHPIANDPNYGGEMWFANSEGARACVQAQEELDRRKQQRLLLSDEAAKEATCPVVDTVPVDRKYVALDQPATDGEVVQQQIPRLTNESIHDFVRRTCVWCARSRDVAEADGDDQAALEFMIRSPGIWLHALEYKFLGKNNDNDSSKTEEKEVQDESSSMSGKSSFCTPLPSWAQFSTND